MSVLIDLSVFGPGTYVIEDDGDPTNGVAQLRAPDGSVILFNVPADFVQVTAAAGRHLVINCAESFGSANINVGSLTDANASPDSITVHRVHTTGTVTLVSNGAITEGGSDAGADIVAGQLILSAQTGVGTVGNAIETQTFVMEAETSTGGIALTNLGALQIGTLTDSVGGLDVATSGNISLTAYGSITLSDATSLESVHGGSASGNVTLVALGSESDIVSTVDNDAIIVAGGNLTLQAGRDIGFGIFGSNFDNDVRARGSITVNAGRDFLIDGFADLASDDFGAATGGNATITAGRNIHLRNVAGTDGSIFANGNAGADVVLTTGALGSLIVDAATSFAVASSSGDVTANADRIRIAAASGIEATSGAVTLRPVTSGREMILGSASDVAFAVELSDAELARIFSSNLTIGGSTTGNVTVTSVLTPGTVTDLTIRSGEDITLLAGLSTTNSIGLIAGNSVAHQSGLIATGTLTAQVDVLGNDAGTGALGRWSTVNPSGVATAASVVLLGNSEADTLWGAQGVDQTVRGHGGNDQIFSSGEGQYFGDDGNDTIVGGLSSGLVDEMLDGGAGTDTLDTTLFGSDYLINMMTGVTNFAYETFVNFENLRTGSGHDTITGTNGANRIESGAGNDVIDARGGADLMIGGSGNDTFYVRDAGDSVIEAVGEGNDTIITYVNHALGAGQQVELLRTPGSASTSSINLTGNEFVNYLAGNAGTNTLNGGAGADTLRGYGGNDTYWIDHSGDILIEAAGQGNDTAITDVSYALAAGVSVETLRTFGSGTTAVIDLTGNEIANTLLGNAAANVLNGAGGADDMRGYAGNDTYYVNNAGDTVTELSGNDTVIATVSYTLAAGVAVELLRTLGSSTTDPLDFTGNELNQTVAGNAAANELNGGAGNDTLWGYGGNDELTGGAGSDTMVFSTALGPGNVDLIHGYVVADDRIMLDDAVFTGLAVGALQAGAFRIGTAAADADDRIIYNSATGELLFDPDGLGGAAAIVFADMSAGLPMTANEFLVF